MSIFDRLFAFVPSRRMPRRVIHRGDDGFSVRHEDSEVVALKWDSVNEIVAFKNDLFGGDEICLGFLCEGHDRYPWAGEEDIGFEELMAEVGRRFKVGSEDWWGKVAFPAYEENWTTIWRRGGRE